MAPLRLDLRFGIAVVLTVAAIGACSATVVNSPGPGAPGDATHATQRVAPALSDEDQVRALLARFVQAVNEMDSDTLLTITVVCDSSPPGADDLYKKIYSRDFLASHKTGGPYTAKADRILIDGDKGRIWVTATYEGSGIDGSRAWGGKDGSDLTRRNGEWRFCRE